MHHFHKSQEDPPAIYKQPKHNNNNKQHTDKSTERCCKDDTKDLSSTFANTTGTSHSRIGIKSSSKRIPKVSKKDKQVKTLKKYCTEISKQKSANHYQQQPSKKQSQHISSGNKGNMSNRHGTKNQAFCSSQSKKNLALSSISSSVNHHSKTSKPSNHFNNNNNNFGFNDNSKTLVLEPKIEKVKEMYSIVYGKHTDNLIELYRFYNTQMQKSLGSKMSGHSLGSVCSNSFSQAESMLLLKHSSDCIRSENWNNANITHNNNKKCQVDDLDYEDLGIYNNSSESINITALINRKHSYNFPNSVNQDVNTRRTSFKLFSKPDDSNTLGTSSLSQSMNRQTRGSQTKRLSKGTALKIDIDVQRSRENIHKIIPELDECKKIEFDLISELQKLPDSMKSSCQGRNLQELSEVGDILEAQETRRTKREILPRRMSANTENILVIEDATHCSPSRVNNSEENQGSGDKNDTPCFNQKRMQKMQELKARLAQQNEEAMKENQPQNKGSPPNNLQEKQEAATDKIKQTVTQDIGPKSPIMQHSSLNSLSTDKLALKSKLLISPMVIPSKLLAKDPILPLNKVAPPKPQFKCYVPTPVNYAKVVPSANQTSKTTNNINEIESTQLDKVFKKNMAINDYKKELNSRLKQLHHSREEYHHNEALDQAIFFEEPAEEDTVQLQPAKKSSFNLKLLKEEEGLPLNKHDISLLEKLETLDRMHSSNQLKIVNGEKQNLLPEGLRKVEINRGFQKSKFFVSEIPKKEQKASEKVAKKQVRLIDLQDLDPILLQQPKKSQKRQEKYNPLDESLEGLDISIKEEDRSFNKHIAEIPFQF